MKKYVDEVMQAQSSGLSLLERKAIGERTALYYAQEYRQFLVFSKKRRLQTVAATEMDAALTEYFNALFLQGHPAHRGNKVIASVMHHRPEFSRQGTCKLPHAWRALKGWRKLAPGSSRQAMPLSVWAAFACEMRRLGFLQMAVFTMLCLSSYSRPGELLRCRVRNLVRPTPTISEFWCLLLIPEERQIPSKVGEFDDSVALDSAFLKPWIHTLLKQLTDRNPDLPLWNFDYGHYSKIFSQISDTFGLDMTPYQMRHSGPSIDRSRNHRSLLEVQKRGRWRSYKSVARYEKSARLGANFQRLPVQLQYHCLVCERQLGEVLLGRAEAWPKRLDVWDMQLVSGNLAMVLLMTSPCLKCSDALDRTSNKD